MVPFWTMRLSVFLLPQSRGFDDGVLCLGVSDGGGVSDARVWPDVCVWAYLAVFAYYDRALDRGSVMYDGSSSDSVFGETVPSSSLPLLLWGFSSCSMSWFASRRF